MVTPPWPSSSSIVGCFPSTFTRSFSTFFDLKILGKVKETVEQFKEIEISLKLGKKINFSEKMVKR